MKQQFRLAISVFGLALASLLFIIKINANPSSIIRLVNEQEQAVVDAKLQFGDSKVLYKTDSAGEVVIPTDWKSNLPIDIEANGYINARLLNIPAEGGEFKIHQQDEKTLIEIKGTTKDYGNLTTDGFLDFGLVIPALSRQDLLSFDMATIISPEVDSIPVFNQTFDVPSNLAIPKQTEKYILNVTINKPQYRVYVRNTGDYRIYGTHGRFPVKTVVDEIRAKKPIFDVINHFQFISAGYVDANVNKPVQGKDIAMSKITFTNTINTRAPTIPAGKVVLSVALNEVDGVLYPSDLKRLSSNQTMKLKVPADKNQKFILSAMVNDQKQELKELSEGEAVSLDSFRATTAQDNFGQLSFVLQKAEDKGTPEFLEPIDTPRIENGELVVSLPKSVQNIQQMGTVIVLSQVEKVGRSEMRTRLWEAYSPSWVDRLNVKSATKDLDKNLKYRWEVLYLGSKAGVDNIEDATHISRNSLDF